MLSLDFSFKLYICQDPPIARAYASQNTKTNALFACLVQRLSAFTPRCRTDKGERGALEPPPEDDARTKRIDREFQFRESHTEAETKKTPDRYKKIMIICTYFSPHSDVTRNLSANNPKKKVCKLLAKLSAFHCHRSNLQDINYQVNDLAQLGLTTGLD